MGVATFAATAYFCYRLKYPKKRQLGYDRFDNNNKMNKEKLVDEFINKKIDGTGRSQIATISSLSEKSAAKAKVSKATADRLENLLLMDSYYNDYDSGEENGTKV